MLSRRDLVGKLAAGAAVLSAIGGARASFALTRRAPNTPDGVGRGEGRPPAAPEGAAPQWSTAVVDSGPPTTLDAPQPWELLHPLAVGSVLAHGWRVSALTGVANGSCVLTLENGRGRTHRVHLCRNDGRPQGLVYTTRFDLVVMNGGQGDLPTDEGLAHAVAEIAHVLAANEGQAPMPTALLPHRERVQRFATAAALR